MVRAGLQGHEHAAPAQQVLVFDAGQCVDFGVGAAVLLVVAFADDGARRADNYAAYHRIGARGAEAQGSQVEGAAHE